MPADRSAGGSGHGGGADLGGGEAVAGPLPVDVPARGVDRAVGGGQEGQGDLRHRPGHAQALLPRLLRPGEKRSIRAIVLLVGPLWTFSLSLDSDFPHDFFTVVTSPYTDEESRGFLQLADPLQLASAAFLLPAQ